MQLPLVVTDVRGCREVVEDGENGFVVPPRDPSALVKAIRRLGDDPELRRHMGDASGRLARWSFDERRVVDLVLATYDDIAQQKHLSERDRHVRPRRRLFARALKRAVDIIGSATLLVVAAPLMAVIAFGVRVTMGRPVLFRQVRPGRHGRLFTILKFRTMRDAADAHGGQLPDAERVTIFGRMLRTTSLDELPELWNVLRGDMSLVGPRPLLVEYLEHYDATQRRRHDVRPGITGWSQLHGRNDQSWGQRFALDVWYVDNWTIGLDARIVARTLPAVLRRHGITEPGHASKPRFTRTVIAQ